MKGLVRAAAIVAGLLLSGCLVSEAPLFDASNASATPLAAGVYDACSGSADETETECNPMTVELGEGGLYTLGVEDDRIEARFLDLGDGDYAIQMTDEGGFMYYWGSLEEGAMTITLLWCSALPRALVDKLVEEGAIETKEWTKPAWTSSPADKPVEDGSVEADEDYTTCTVKTPGAVIAAAKSYAAGEAKSDSWVVLTPASAAQ